MIVGARDSAGKIMAYEVDTSDHKDAIRRVRAAIVQETGKEPLVVLASVK